MTANGFDYVWDDNLCDGMGGWRIKEHENTKPFRDADDFLTALNERLS